MTENTPARRLPVRLPPHSDELLSSWIGRHAAFYAVPPLVMLRHCLPEAPSLRAADLHLSSDQEARLANIWFFLTLCGSSCVSDVVAMGGHANEIEMVARPRGQDTGCRAHC